MPIRKIISGGQTGADRAALDAAIELGLGVGGWVPKGRRAEDGTIPDRYPNMIETDSQAYAVRTRLNVRDSDATVVLSDGRPSGGSALTIRIAHALGKPVLHLDLESRSPSEAAERLGQWLASVEPATLNVAGPRASKDPHISDATKAILIAALDQQPGVKP